MRYRVLARRLYMDTRSQQSFSSNDLRRYNLHTLIQNVGAFFRWMQTNGYALRVGGELIASHEASHGRRVGEWVWTSKAEAMFNK